MATTDPAPPRRTRRPHAAAGARVLAGGLSAATVVALMAGMARADATKTSSTDAVALPLPVATAPPEPPPPPPPRRIIVVRRRVVVPAPAATAAPPSSGRPATRQVVATPVAAPAPPPPVAPTRAAPVAQSRAS